MHVEYHANKNLKQKENGRGEKNNKKKKSKIQRRKQKGFVLLLRIHT